jgi:hypothetical protein
VFDRAAKRLTVLACEEAKLGDPLVLEAADFLGLRAAA